MSHGQTLSRESNRQNGVMPTQVIYAPFLSCVRVDSKFDPGNERKETIVFHSKLILNMSFSIDKDLKFLFVFVF